MERRNLFCTDTFPPQEKRASEWRFLDRKGKFTDGKGNIGKFSYIRWDGSRVRYVSVVLAYVPDVPRNPNPPKIKTFTLVPEPVKYVKGD